jgi:hypothetical protein
LPLTPVLKWPTPATVGYPPLPLLFRALHGSEPTLLIVIVELLIE